MTVLSGRRALVTGGSRAIGAAIVQRLACNGAQVVFTLYPRLLDKQADAAR